MKIIRYVDSDLQIHYGAEGSYCKAQRIAGDIFSEFTVTRETADAQKLLAPIVPTSILRIGLNYQQHAAETGATVPEYPILFTKGFNTLQNPGAPIFIPMHLRSDEVDYECELAVVIGKPCKNVPRELALNYVLGYSCANDVSVRDWQIKKGGGQWCRGKTFDTFCPLGPCLSDG